MTSSFRSELKRYDRKAVKAEIDYLFPVRNLPPDYVPCPESHCRQWRLYFQTDKVGWKDCPICDGDGWVPPERVAPRKKPQPDTDHARQCAGCEHIGSDIPTSPSTSGRVIPLFPKEGE